MFGVLLAGACSDGREAEPVPEPAAAETAALISANELAPGFHALVVDADVPPADFVTLAKDACGSEAICAAGVWVDGAAAPRGFPMTDREVASEVFHYSVNRNTGYEQTIWNCERYPQEDPANCGAGAVD